MEELAKERARDHFHNYAVIVFNAFMKEQRRLGRFK